MPEIHREVSFDQRNEIRECPAESGVLLVEREDQGGLQLLVWDYLEHEESISLPHVFRVYSGIKWRDP